MSTLKFYNQVKNFMTISGIKYPYNELAYLNHSMIMKIPLLIKCRIIIITQ